MGSLPAWPDLRSVLELGRGSYKVSHMSDLIDAPMPGSNTPEFSVGELAGAVKKLVEGELGWVRVRGEVGLKAA